MSQFLRVQEEIEMRFFARSLVYKISFLFLSFVECGLINHFRWPLFKEKGSSQSSSLGNKAKRTQLITSSGRGQSLLSASVVLSGIKLSIQVSKSSNNFDIVVFVLAWLV